jgi:hypothetical protein
MCLPSQVMQAAEMGMIVGPGYPREKSLGDSISTETGGLQSILA